MLISVLGTTSFGLGIGRLLPVMDSVGILFDRHHQRGARTEHLFDGGVSNAADLKDAEKHIDKPSDSCQAIALLQHPSDY